MNKPTQGTWKVHRPSIGEDQNWHVTDDGDTFVAHVYGFNHSVDEQSRANAHLISAAPDLLKFAEQFMAELEANNISTSRHAAYKSYDAMGMLRILARAAITKAKGEQL